MADARKIIEFVFQASDGITPALDSMSSGLDGFNNKIQGVAQPLGDFSESLVKTEAAILAAGAALAGYAISEAVKFQAATLDLQKVLDDTDPSIEGFKEAAIGLSNAFGVAATDVLASTAEFKQAGFTAEEALSLVEHSLTLLNVSELNAAEGAELFVRLLKGYNAPASDATKILDILNEVSNVYAVSVGQLGEAMARAAPIASQMGFSYEELAGVMTPMVEVFQSSELAASAFNTVMQRLVGDSAPVVSTLQELGISQTDLNGEMKSGKDILTEVQLAFQKLTPEMKLVHAQELAGVEQAAKMVIAFDNLSKITEVTATAMDAAGSAQKELNVRMQAAEVLINKANEAWRNTAILLGDQVLPEFSEVVKAIGSIGIAVQKAIDAGAFKPLTDAAKRLLAELAVTFEQIAQALPEALEGVDFSQLIEALEDLGITIGSIFDGVDLTTPEGLRIAIQKIVDVITALTRFTEGFVSQWVPFVQAIFNGTGAFSQLSPEMQKAAGAFGGMMSIVSNAKPLIEGATSAIQFLSYAVGASGLVNAIKLVVPYMAILTGPVGIAVIGAASLLAADSFFGWSTSIGKVAKEMLGLSPSVEEVAEGLLTQSTATEDLTGAMGAMVGAAMSAVIAEDKLTAAEQKQIEETYRLIPSFETLDATLLQMGKNYVEVAGDFRMAGVEVKEALDGQTNAVEDGLASWRELGGVTRDATLANDLAAQGFKFVTQEVTDLNTGATHLATVMTYTGKSMEDTGNQGKEALSKTAEETLRATEAANDFALSWEQIASDERKLIYEVSAQIAIAEIEAGTERVKAAFESVNVAVESTGETLLGLAGILAQVGSGPNSGIIIDLLEEENRRRQEALDLQKKLVESQVKYLDAVTARLTQGEAMIQVTADGLEPELEAFMMKVIERVQVKASQEAQTFLLGL